MTSDERPAWLDAYLGQQAEATPATPTEEARPGEWRGVWTWIELAGHEVLPASLELLGRGREIADELGTRNGAVVFGHGVKDRAGVLGEHGADRVYVQDAPDLADFSLGRARRALTQAVQDKRPEILLFPATIQGRNLAAQLSTALGTGIVPNCGSLTLDATERLVIGHQTSYNERMLSDVVVPLGRPQIFTITPGSYRRPTRDAARKAAVVELPPLEAVLAPRVRVLSREPERPPALAQTDAVVGCGIGLRTQEGVELARDLAKELSAYVGATRGAVALGWIDPNHLITMIRHQLRPRLYVACGVIGEYDHLKAIEDAALVVALTSDPNAPVTEHADLIGVGDPTELLRRLVEHLRKAKTERVLVGPGETAP